MTKELSALLDGEIEQHETSALWASLRADPRKRATWSAYSLIGDALRGEVRLSADITGRVMMQLADEPVVLAPKTGRQRSTWQGSILAIAASLAGVAVVGWLVLAQQQPIRESNIVARLDQRQQATVNLAQATPGNGMQEYLLAHQANAPGLHLPGGAQHIRTVSIVSNGQ